MAISVMNRVWKHCKAGGNGLLLMLAIADHANEHGAAWPGFRLLQQKCKIKNRQTITRNLRQLEVKGELIIQPQKGPHGTHWYQVCSGMPLEKVDSWRTELGLPPRDLLSLEDEIEDDPVQPLNQSTGEKVVTGLNHDDEEAVQELNHKEGKAVTELNHPDSEQVVTEVNQSESGKVVQSGYASGSIVNEGGSIVNQSGVTAEPKPLLTLKQQPPINQYLTANFNFREFKRMVLMQLPQNSRYTTEFEHCELHGVAELAEDRRVLMVEMAGEKAAKLFQSRLAAMTAQIANGVDPKHNWEVVYGWKAGV